MKTKRTSLREFLHCIIVLGEDKDIYVDGINGIAYCGTRLTKEGEEYFRDALDGTYVEDYCVMSDNDKDYDLIDEEEGNLCLAWEMFVSMAGYCDCDNYDKWFNNEWDEDGRLVVPDRNELI